MAQYVDVYEVSRLTGLSPTALRRGARIGRFPYTRMNPSLPKSKMLFDIQAVAQVLATEAQASVSQSWSKSDYI